MSEKRDLGGSLVTDYSKSSISPERARKLNLAEVEYVNGVRDDESMDEIYWPTYSSLAEKYELPLHVVNEQARKHRWASRREQRKTQLIAFKNEQTRKRWLEEDRVIMDVMHNNVAKNAAVLSRLTDEHIRKIQRAVKEEEDRRADGEDNPIVECGISPGQAEALARALKTGVDTAKTLMDRAAGLPTVLPELAPPTLIKTVEQEEAEEKMEIEASMPKATVLDIYKEMRAIEEQRAAMPKHLIYGELEDDDDDDEGDVIIGEVV